MKHNLKALGLALVAVLAIGAVAASAASAATDDFNSEVAGETILDASAMNKQVFKATASDTKEIICEEVSLVAANSRIKGTLVKEVTVEPKYEKCSVWEIKNPTTSGGETVKELATAKVEVNGCHYLLTGATTTTAATSGEFATVHLLGCSDATKGITIKVSALNTECIHVSEQTLEGVQYADVIENTFKAIKLTARVHEISSDTTHHAVVCETPSKGTETHVKGGTYTGEVTVTGTDAAKPATQTGIFLSSTP